MTICTLVDWLLFVAVILFLNPEKLGNFALVLFYLTLFFALLGTFSLIFLIIRLKAQKRRPIFPEISLTFRWGLWLAFIIAAAIFLKKIALLSWINAIIGILFFVILEILFMSLSHKYQYEGEDTSNS